MRHKPPVDRERMFYTRLSVDCSWTNFVDWPLAADAARG
jgi:hypothetical protein